MCSKRLKEQDEGIPAMDILTTFDKKNYSPDMPFLTREAVRAIISIHNKMALVKSDKYGYYKFPGGGIEKGETHLEALIRETREETGLKLSPQSVKAYGMVKELRKDLYENKIFQQISYYYLAEAEAPDTRQSTTGLNLDSYEAEEGYHLELVPRQEALLANESLHNDVYSDFLNREAYVLRLLGLKTKAMDRKDWNRIIKREYVYESFNSGSYSGAVGLLRLEEITSPLTVTVLDEKITLVERNYKWLQFAFSDKPVWLTVMLDHEDRILQYYFDITWGNFINSEGTSWFYDLYLDVVMLPDGRILLLDEDELGEAMEERIIDRRQYDMACQTAENLMKILRGREKELADFCMHFYKKLSLRLPSPQ